MKAQQPAKTINRTITKWVISLHQKGYTDDFLPVGNNMLQCAQSGERFDLQDLRIKIIDCGYDLLTKTYKYIHTIDTQVGNRGLLVVSALLSTLNKSTAG